MLYSEGIDYGCPFRSGDVQKSPTLSSSTLTNLAGLWDAAWEEAVCVELKMTAVSISAWEPDGCQDLGVDFASLY